MSRITSTWKPDRQNGNCETKITLAPNFKSLSRIEKLDFLKDTLWALEHIYQGLLVAHNQGGKTK